MLRSSHTENADPGYPLPHLTRAQDSEPVIYPDRELPPVPGTKYEQLAQYLLQRYVIVGEPGDRLPPERTLQEQFSVSRQTVRNALSLLTERGHIYNVHGSGSYIAPRNQARFTPRMRSYLDDMSQRGHEGSTRVIATQWVEAEEAICASLGLEAGTSVLYVRRLRLADQEVIGYERIYLSPDAGQALLQAMMENMGQPVNQGSNIFEQLEGSAFAMRHGSMRVGAALSTVEDYEEFNQLIEPGQAMMDVSVIGYTDIGIPVEHSRTLYTQDAYFYEIIL